MMEFDEAIALANKILDQPYRDPDDDLSMMSRQFLRQVELNVQCKLALQALDDASIAGGREFVALTKFQLIAWQLFTSIHSEISQVTRREEMTNLRHIWPD